MGRRNFKAAQRAYDSMEPPEYWESEESDETESYRGDYGNSESGSSDNTLPDLFVDSIDQKSIHTKAGD